MGYKLCDNHDMKLTRREWSAALIAPAAATAQTPVPAGADDELAKAREEQRRASAVIAGMKVAIETEPAFSFRP